MSDGHPSAVGRAQDREVRRSKTDVLPPCHARNMTPTPVKLNVKVRGFI